MEPDQSEAWRDLGMLLRRQGRLGEAAECLRRVAQLAPLSAAAHNDLGNLLQEQGGFAEAIAWYRRAIELDPDYGGAYNNLGAALKSLGNFDEAIASYRRCLELQPDDAGVSNNLGKALVKLGRLDEAIACAQRAIQLKPDYADAYNSLAVALQIQGQIDAAIACYAPALQLDPSDVTAASNYLCVLRYHPDATPTDSVSTRFRAVAAEWRLVNAITDDQLADQVRKDRIDVLFDLTGHDPRNRLLVFARKPAPIQITWINSVGTTGLSAIDYVLADRHVIPPEAEPHYAERVLRMPDGYLCFEPPDDAPLAGPLPAEDRGHVTFGSFNRPLKMHPKVINVWARILARLPGSRLFLKGGEFESSGTGPRYARLFAAEGIDPGRVEFEGFSPPDEYFQRYQRIDITLDPFPHCGGLTTCDSLWMGVPVITCPGETFASRQSLSHLSNIGLTETIAADLDEYVEIAVTLAQDLPRLAAIRAGLREQMARSPLCDGKRFAENLLVLLRDVWRRWVQSVGTKDGPTSTRLSRG